MRAATREARGVAVRPPCLVCTCVRACVCVCARAARARVPPLEHAEVVAARVVGALGPLLPPRLALHRLAQPAHHRLARRLLARARALRAVVGGGATGLIGDPSFKAQERALNTPDIVAGWVERLRTQMSQFLSFDGDAAAVMANNLDWTAEVDVLTFLRDVGKHFSVNSMISKE